MAVNDVYRIEVFQNVGSELTMNVLHARESVSETINSPLVAPSIIEMTTVLYDALAAQLSDDWRVVQISARRVAPTPGVPSTLVLGGAESIVGGIASEIVPAQAAVLIALYTENFERTGRGRQYIPGLPVNAQNEGQLTEAVHDDIQTAATAEYVGEKGPFLAGDGKWFFHVWSPGLAVSGSNDVIAAEVRTNLATQRRRRAFPGFGT